MSNLFFFFYTYSEKSTHRETRLHAHERQKYDPAEGPRMGEFHVKKIGYLQTTFLDNYTPCLRNPGSQKPNERRF